MVVEDELNHILVEKAIIKRSHQQQGKVYGLALFLLEDNGRCHTDREPLSNLISLMRQQSFSLQQQVFAHLVQPQWGVQHRDQRTALFFDTELRRDRL